MRCLSQTSGTDGATNADRLQTPAIASHRDLSAISKTVVWHPASHPTLVLEINMKDSPQTAGWTLSEPCGKRNDTAAPLDQSLTYLSTKLLTLPRINISLQALQGVHLMGGLNIPLPCRMIQGFHSSHERAHWSQGVVSHPNVSSLLLFGKQKAKLWLVRLRYGEW